MQCSRALRALPVAVAVAVTSLSGQARYRVNSDGEWFLQAAGERRLGQLVRGAVVRDAGGAQGDWLKVALEGWIFGRSVGAATRPGFDLSVTAAPDENVRAAPNGELVARLLRGAQLNRVSEQSGWVQVRREGWVRRRAVSPIAQQTAAAPGPSRATAGVDTAAAVDAAAARAARATTAYRAPGGREAGQLAAETPVRVLTRGEEWSRIQLEAWVRTSDLAAAPPGVLLGVTAAEVRADPARYEGQVLRWTLQYIATQTADELRPDIPMGGTYLLAKGPLPERGFVYVVVPDSLRAGADALTPLAQMDVTVRVRRGRSRYLGHPVVDLLALETRR